MIQMGKKHKIIPWISVSLASLSILLVNGCAKSKLESHYTPTSKPYKAMGKWYQPRSHSVGFRQTGLASWYGEDFHGKKTANGEIYDMYAITAAHKTLPFNTYVRVKNLKNSHKLDVRINDRGPFVRGRIIDLSYTAAKKLGIVGPGTAPVEIVALGMIADAPTKKDEPQSYDPVDYQKGNFTFQVGAFLDQQNAERLKAKLAKTYVNAHIATYQSGEKTYYRVRVGKFNTLKKAMEYEKNLMADGYEPIIVAE
jgi:rare lipoprotein A